MTAQIKKLLSLNLALLLFVMAGLPAYAQQPEQQPIQQAVRTPREDMSQSLELLAEDEPYLISVDGVSFYSDTDREGEDWSYVARNNLLVLEDYFGASIRASGDLRIYTYGDVVITGSDGNNYGSDGIVASGSIDLDVHEGSLQVSGGSGNISGGCAVYTSGMFMCSTYDASASFTGGATYLAQHNGKPTWGGDAISVYDATFFGDGITITGGAGSQEEGAYGGCGIYATEVWMYADCEITGGNAYVGAPGIYFEDYCRFDAVNAQIYTGDGPYGMPALYSPSSDATLRTSAHTTVSSKQFSFITTVNQYRLTLLGSGGLIEGTATFTSLKAYYPASYPLWNYLFTRTDYVQVGWQEGTDGYLSLNTRYTPQANTTLRALWEEAAPGDVILNALNGSLSADETVSWEKHQTAQVTLPETVVYSYHDLMGWCTQIHPVSDSDTWISSGTWYDPGTTFEADPETATQLYAVSDGGGMYAVYHTNGGTATAGGNLIVQGTSASGDLQVYIPGDDAVIAPVGYQFTGWADTADATQPQYQGGDALQLESLTVKHLYAQWEKATLDEGLVITADTREKTLQVILPASWCEAYQVEHGIVALYHPDTGKLLSADAAVCQTGKDLSLSVSYTGNVVPQYTVLLLDETYKPLGDGVRKTLPAN